MRILIFVDDITLWDSESTKPDTVELVIDGIKVTVTKPKAKPAKRKTAVRKPLSITSTDEHKGD